MVKPSEVMQLYLVKEVEVVMVRFGYLVLIMEPLQIATLHLGLIGQRHHLVSWGISYTESEAVFKELFEALLQHLHHVVVKHHGEHAWAAVAEWCTGWVCEYLLSDGAHCAHE